MSIGWYIVCIGEDYQEDYGTLFFTDKPEIGQKVDLRFKSEDEPDYWRVSSVNENDLSLTVNQWTDEDEDKLQLKISKKSQSLVDQHKFIDELKKIIKLPEGMTYLKIEIKGPSEHVEITSSFYPTPGSLEEVTQKFELKPIDAEED